MFQMLILRMGMKKLNGYPWLAILPMKPIEHAVADRAL